MKKLLIIFVLLILACTAVNANMVEIYDMDAWVDGDKDSGVTSSGGTADNVKPESIVKISIELKNLYDDDNGDLDLEDVEVIATLRDIDDEGTDDIERDETISKISPNKKKSVDFEFKIPLAVEDRAYVLDIEVNAEDENGTTFTVTEEIDIDVEKDNHAIKFYKIDASPEKLCSGAIELEVGSVNIGTNEEDVELTVLNDALGIDETVKFTLEEDPYDSDSRRLKTFNFRIPSGKSNNDYKLDVKAEFAGRTFQNYTTITIACDVPVAKPATTATATTTTTANTAATTTTTNAATVDNPSSETEYKTVPKSSEVVSTNGRGSSFTIGFVFVEIIIVLLLIWGIMAYRKK